MFLYEVLDCLEKAKVKYALVGGYALALHGIVRATIDVDLIVQLNVKQMSLAEEALKGIGLTSRIPVDAGEIINFRKEFIEQRNLIAWSFVDFKNPSRMVDIIITEGLKNLKVEKVSVYGRKIPVASLNDLKRMKIGTGRKKDELDVESIDEVLNGR